MLIPLITLALMWVDHLLITLMRSKSSLWIFYIKQVTIKKYLTLLFHSLFVHLKLTRKKLKICQMSKSIKKLHPHQAIIINNHTIVNKPWRVMIWSVLLRDWDPWKRRKPYQQTKVFIINHLCTRDIVNLFIMKHKVISHKMFSQRGNQA